MAARAEREMTSSSACSLKRCFACCEGHGVAEIEEKREHSHDDTIIKAEHSASLGFMNSEASQEQDRLHEWREGNDEEPAIEETEAMQVAREAGEEAVLSAEDPTASRTTNMSFLSVPATQTTRRQSLVEVPSFASAAAKQRQSIAEVGLRNYSSTGQDGRSWRVRVRRMINSKGWEMISMLVVFCALFLTDIYGFAQVTENTSLDVLMMGCFSFFVLELAANSFVTEAYINSFFFWMDIFGTASLIFDISFFLGVDATQPVRYENDDDMSSDTAVLARASRAAKQAARAGRMSRILKLIRFLPFLRPKKQQGFEVANAVSMKLTTMLATRVAFLCVGIVIAIPLFSTFVYPVAEDSLISWAILISNDIGAYRMNATTSRITRINSELERFGEFYQNLMYGPFGLCIRENGSFVCSDSVLPGLQLPEMDFAKPRRAASIAEVEYVDVLLLFSLELVRQYEAMANLCLMFCVLLIMLLTCFLMNSSVNKVVLKPLQRVGTVLRQHCAEIMKMTFELKETDEGTGRMPSKELSSNGEDKEHEVDLLEKVMAKIVHIFEVAVPTSRRSNNEEEALWVDNFAGPVEKDKTEAPIMLLQGADTLEDHSAGISADIRNQLDNRTFNVFEASEEQQRLIALHVMTNTRSCRKWLRRQQMRDTLVKFIASIQSKYQANPFHNFGHGLDVLSEVRVYLHSIKSYTILSEVTVFWLLVAALGHDVSHLGVNNQFLVETSHALALKYNDKSVLENFHCATLFEVLSDSSTNVLKVLEKADYKVARAGIVDVILGTDMVRHNEDIKALSIAYTVHQEAFSAASDGHPEELSKALQEDAKARVKVLGSLLHTADISNPLKPWAICEFLADRCLEEFFAQGDQEKELGIPVQMLNDRDKVNRCTSQVGFIEFVITPLAEQMVVTFPALSFLTQNLSINIETWAEEWKTSFDPSAEEYEKLQGRVAKVVARCNAASPWWKDAGPRHSRPSVTSGLSGSESVVTEH